jgi:hypothetical protein
MSVHCFAPCDYAQVQAFERSQIANHEPKNFSASRIIFSMSLAASTAFSSALIGVPSYLRPRRRSSRSCETFARTMSARPVPASRSSERCTLSAGPRLLLNSVSDDNLRIGSCKPNSMIRAGSRCVLTKAEEVSNGKLCTGTKHDVRAANTMAISGTQSAMNFVNNIGGG